MIRLTTTLLTSIVISCTLHAQIIPDGTYEYRDTASGEQSTTVFIERFSFVDGMYYTYERSIKTLKGTSVRQKSLNVKRDTSNRGTYRTAGEYIYLEDLSQLQSVFVDSASAAEDSVTISVNPLTSENCDKMASCWLIITSVTKESTQNVLKKLLREDKGEMPYQITLPKSKGAYYFKIYPPEYSWVEMMRKVDKNLSIQTYHKLDRGGDAPQAMLVKKVTNDGIELQHIHRKDSRVYKRLK